MNLQRAPQSPLPAGDRTKQPSPFSRDALLIKLPLLATVARLVADRGFGFARCESTKDEQFLHVTAALDGRRDFLGMEEGDLLLCQRGTSPRRSGQKCLVQWARAADLDWGETAPPANQSELDALRREALRKRSLNALHQQLNAPWYVKLWNGEAPADLYDPLLAEEWCERISQLDPDALRRVGVGERLKSCLYEFRDNLDPASHQCSVKELLETFTPAQLAVLGPPKKVWLERSWSEDRQSAETFRPHKNRQGPLNEEQKSALLEWFILGCAIREPEDGYDGWLAGNEPYEAAAAQRILARGEPVPRTARPWMAGLANRGWLSQAYVDRLAAEDPSTAAVLFGKLSPEGRRRAVEEWVQNPGLLTVALEGRASLIGEIAVRCALAIDLETDGERIWEIGCAQGDASARLYDERQGTDIFAPLADLASRVRDAAVVVGHNILAWDWPILAPRLALHAEPLIWDTLLVQCVLEPQSASHALGGAHHAEADAEATLTLFARQIAQLPAAFAAQVLTGHFRDAGELLKAIATAVAGEGSLARPAPKILLDRGHEPPRVLLLPDAAIRNMDWVPGVVVVQVDPQQRLPQPLWQIDATRLEAQMTVEQRRNPFAQVLLAVAKRAHAEDIALRRNMLPVWLLERFPDLSAAVDRACVIPEKGRWTCVSPLPSSAEWWAQVDASAVRALLPDGPVLIVDRSTSLDDGIVRADGQNPALLFRSNGLLADRWVLRDRPAQLLKLRGGWQSFRTVKVPKSLTVDFQWPVAPACRPFLATRPHPVLHPGSQDQATYWTGVLQSFREALGPDAGAVPLLLIGSTASREMMDMLATAFAEIGMGEICPAHRSRREHLRRAAQGGFAIVDVVDHWQDWQSLAVDAGIALQPVVEALPVEEWFALADAETRVTNTDDLRYAGTATSATPTEMVTVSGAELFEALPNLIGHYLAPWLRRTGLGVADRGPIIIDPRADAVSAQVRAWMDTRPLTGLPLSTAQRTRLDVVFASLQITREEARSDLISMENFLVTNWQPPGQSGGNAVTGFKPTQKLAIEAIRTRANDVMVALPTGEGKSVLFQVPALCRGLRNRRLTLVLSPLKALMRDQVARLHEQGFAESADYLTSDRPSFENAEVLQGVLDHRIVLLYVAPERLRNATFIDVLDRRMQSDGGLEYVVFDETHCVNQWGYEFRPDYFYAFNFLLQRLRAGSQPDVTPFLLLSATITASDRRSLKEILDRGSKSGAVLPLKICPDPETFSNPLRSHIQVEPLQVRGNIFESQDLETALAERLPHLVDVVRKARQNREATGQRSAVIIFVSRRAHAEDVASRLAKAVSCDVECFHAGLDAATRDDIYSRFRDGDLDVLVATKAFGMGMDIPDIHWVVHLSPPAYLEDYLQEVGRIGRGLIERKRAGLESLSAVMLFSPVDFENMRSLRVTNELRAPQISEIETKILDRSQEIEGQKIAIVPQHGFEPYKSASQMRANATRLRMALHWLEKAEHLEQLGMVADLLTVDLFPTKLSEIGQEQSVVGAVAQAILCLASEPDRDRSSEGQIPPTPSDTGFLGGLLQRLSELIGVRASTPSKAAPPRAAPAPVSEAIINLSQIRIQCRINTMGDTMACLVDLQRRGGLKLRWTFEFARRPLLSEPPDRLSALLESVGAAVRKLIRQLGKKGRAQFSPLEWLDEADWGLPDPERSGTVSRKEELEREALLRRYRRAYVHGFRSLARASGVRLQQSVREESEGVVWQGSLARALSKTALGRCSELLKMAPSLLSIFAERDAEAEQTGVRSVEVYDLISRMQNAHPQKRFHTADLEALLRLLSALNLISAQPDLIPTSYVLALRNAPIGLESHPELVEELNGVNDLAETRMFAMEIFANLPDRAREPFIRGYFASANAVDLKGFLETQLGEIEDDGEDSSSFIEEKRDQLRATKATEFFSRFQASEEPAQWEAIRYPFDRHLIVNAGPGAGKTSVLVGRIAHLIREQHVKPSEIMVLAFNRAVVFEIKQRVRELFRSLGYASYAGQVRVSTFHSLAMRSLHQADGRDEQSGWEDLLPAFASRLSSSALFREQVTAGCRSILVDEFQDVTEDVYSIIRNLYLGSGTRAGVMVIGDDDQDILRWQRRNASRGGSEFSEVFFDRFKIDFGNDKLAILDLKVNFRSGESIVQLSQKMISVFFSRNVISRRLKDTQLRQRDGAAADRCERIYWRGRNWDDTLGEVADICARLLTENPGSLAVLCRSNSEVAEVHHYLAHRIHRLTVLSGANMAVAGLRHVGHWIDFIETEILAQDRLLTLSLKQDLLGRFRDKIIIPETRSAGIPSVDISVLWDLCCEEHAFPHLSNLVRFIRSLQTDELQRLQGSRPGDTNAVVSTIHKVKGLEFDNVVIVPSRNRFGENSGHATSLEKDAAEEARLLYVAMTRAKTRLVYLVGDREYSWAEAPPRPFAGEHGQSQVLTGGLDEVGLGWAMQVGQFNPDPDDCQRYIEQEVCVGDSVILGGLGSGAHKGLMHCGKLGKLRQIGFIAKKYGAGNGNADLKVSAVVRYGTNEKNPAMAGKLAGERGWGYAVLVAGRLR